MSLLSSSFQEPSSLDMTSAPPEPTHPVTQALNKKKKKDVKIKNPADLGRAIALSRRARQSSHKWG